LGKEVTLGGTLRRTDPAGGEGREREIGAATRGVTGAWGADYRFELQRGSPVLVNEPAMTAVAQAAAARVLEPTALQRTGPPIMAGEDFAPHPEHLPRRFAPPGVGAPPPTQPPPHPPRPLLPA